MSVQVPVWTGRFEFDLIGRCGLSVATVEVAVHLDIVLFWIGNRTLAVLDRDRLRRWAHHPERPLAVDDAEFTLLENQLAICADGSAPYPLSAEAVHHFVTHL